MRRARDAPRAVWLHGRVTTLQDQALRRSRKLFGPRAAVVWEPPLGWFVVVLDAAPNSLRPPATGTRVTLRCATLLALVNELRQHDEKFAVRERWTLLAAS